MENWREREIDDSFVRVVQYVDMITDDRNGMQNDTHVNGRVGQAEQQCWSFAFSLIFKCGFPKIVVVSVALSAHSIGDGS